MEFQWLVASGGFMADLVDRIRMRGVSFFWLWRRGQRKWLEVCVPHRLVCQDSRGLRVVQTSLVQLDPSRTAQHPFRTPLRIPVTLPLGQVWWTWKHHCC